MRSYPADDGVHAICPHCWADDLDPHATRCRHCGGSFGWSAWRRNLILIVGLTIVVNLVVSIAAMST